MVKIRRALELPPPGQETFFLWGPRQTGKSTLLRALYPDALWIDLLRAEELRRYTQNPEWLREEVERAGRPFVVIDEVQKVPALLDEVHWLHERRGVHFALCGSSARKVRRGGANLLGGRGARFELHGLSAHELGPDFDLERMLNHGTLPRLYVAAGPRRLQASYVGNYLKEEVMAEGLVRRLPVFSEFLNAAALSDGEQVNCSTIARDTGVSSTTIAAYIEVLVDTLVGRWLPAYRRSPKRRLIQSPKFYFADVGVAGFLARRGHVTPGSPSFGKAFESWVLHELSAYNAYHERSADLFYWRLTTGVEVDFIVNDLEVALEAKATPRVTRDHLKGLRELRRDHPRGGRRVVVCLDHKARTTEDGIEVLPVAEFISALWSGQLF